MPIFDFAIATQGLGSDQSSIMITKSLNEIVKQYTYVCPIVFYKDYYQSIVKQNFCTLQCVYMFCYHGPVITTDLDTLQDLISSPCPSHKFLYVMDLEWLYLHPSKSYEKLTELYCHPDIQLISKSISHYNILKKCWKEPIGVVKDLNPQELLKLIQK